MTTPTADIQPTTVGENNPNTESKALLRKQLHDKLHKKVKNSQFHRSGQAIRQQKQEIAKETNKVKRKQLAKILNQNGLRYILKQFGIENSQMEWDILKEIRDNNITTIQEISEIIFKYIPQARPSNQRSQNVASIQHNEATLPDETQPIEPVPELIPISSTVATVANETTNESKDQPTRKQMSKPTIDVIND